MTLLSPIRHRLSQSGQLCGQSGSGGRRRRQELPEELLRYSGRWYQKLFFIISSSSSIISLLSLLSPHTEVFVTFNLSEKFDTDLRTLQPPEEKHYLNPRLSISTRFLSRFQDRIRSVYRQSSGTLRDRVDPQAVSLKSAPAVFSEGCRAERRLLSQSRPGS